MDWAAAEITANNETLWNTFADLPNGTDELGHYAGDELFWTGSNSGLRVAGLTLGSTPSAIAISPIYDAGVFEGFNLVTLPAAAFPSCRGSAAVSGVLTVPVPEPSSLAPSPFSLRLDWLSQCSANVNAELSSRPT